MNRAGRKPVRAGRSALRNRPSWNTELETVFVLLCNAQSIVAEGRQRFALCGNERSI